MYFNYSYFNCSRTSIVAQREFTIEMIGNRLRSGITPGTESRGAEPSTWGTFASWEKVVVFWYIVFPTERTTRFKTWSECNDLTFISFKLVKLSQVMALLNGFLFRKGWITSNKVNGEYNFNVLPRFSCLTSNWGRWSIVGLIMSF